MQSICSFLLQAAAKRSRESAEQASLKRSLSGTPPYSFSSMDCIAIHLLSHLLQTAAKRRRESEGQSSLRRGLGRQPHHSPSMDCIAIHLLSPFFKPPRSGDGSLRDNRPSGGVWGGNPIVPHPHRPLPSPPSLDAYLSPFHHRRTRSARKRIKLPVRHVLDSVVRLYRTRRRRSRRRYAVAMRRRHAPA